MLGMDIYVLTEEGPFHDDGAVVHGVFSSCGLAMDRARTLNGDEALSWGHGNKEWTWQATATNCSYPPTFFIDRMELDAPVSVA